MSRGFLNSSKNGESTTSLENLCQCSVTLSVKMCSGRDSWFSSLCSLPLVLTLGTTEKSLILSSLHLLFRCLYTLIRSYSASSSTCGQPQLPQPSVLCEMFLSFHHLWGPLSDSLCWALSRMSMSLVYWEPSSGESIPGMVSVVLSREEGSPSLTHCQNSS